MALKIHIYTIAKNEEQFCERWVKSCAGADGLHVLDTGSSDKTYEKLSILGVNVKVATFDPWKTLPEYDAIATRGGNPWRFDVPRNLNIDMIPDDADVCLQVDMDETLVENWREIIDKFWTSGTTRLDYFYAWAMNGDVPVKQFHYNKCHCRHGYHWIRPVHEVLWPKGKMKEKFATCGTLLVKHYPDNSKSRGSYLNLLQLSCRENPLETMNSFNLCREFTFYSMWNEAIAEGKRYLALPDATWGLERCTACILISRSYGALKDKKEQEKWLLRAASEEPHQREGWCELADYYRINEQYLGGYFAAKRVLEVKNHPMSHHCDSAAWGAKPYDIAAVCSFWGGFKSESLDYSWSALKEDPFDNRLLDNYEITQKIVSKSLSSGGDPVIDVIILAWSKDSEHYKMTERCIRNLRLSSSGIPLNITVVETNKNIREESFSTEPLFGENVSVRTPDEPFGYNRYLQIAYEHISGMKSKFIMILNNDVVAFSKDFILKMIIHMNSFSSISPHGLREAKWGRIDEKINIHPGYDLNVINGWCLMFDKAILNSIPFNDLFPEELKFHRQDEFYADMLKMRGLRHALACDAQALHLQAQSHSLLDEETKRQFTHGMKAPYEELLKKNGIKR